MNMNSCCWLIMQLLDLQAVVLWDWGDLLQLGTLLSSFLETGWTPALSKHDAPGPLKKGPSFLTTTRRWSYHKGPTFRYRFIRDLKEGSRLSRRKIAFFSNCINVTVILWKDYDLQVIPIFGTPWMTKKSTRGSKSTRRWITDQKSNLCSMNC